ncbi:uncharacterized protein LOC128880213 isoform X1 [Hylaeus volcanicus]|uniref:uncharacterized protein LOC128880213 isoform X1 n=1 Tax=Hylaeus volcanicus TaxID=313075 RepID=UPI0023B7D8F2|nr:uncharacterized protein LOC128880213 isoform X1 [Hylaeus volcanicus]XP_053986015.1 uncharacterized protein LOC128880213 isoform X1 [Hylaeus volcanicus]
MLLSLFRLAMIVPLLISAVSIQVNDNQLTLDPLKKSEAVQRVQKNAIFSKENAKSTNDRNEHLAVRKRQLDKVYGPGRSGERNLMESRIPRLADGYLARKMAKEALKSPRMQETMHKLTHGRKPPHRQAKLYASVKVPTVPRRKSSLDAKKHGSETRPKGRKKKKRKRKRHHRQRYRNQHAGWQRRGSSKRTLTTRSDTKNENFIAKRTQAVNDVKSRNKGPVAKSNVKITAVEIDGNDYIDLSTTSNTESSISSMKTRQHGKPMTLRDSENMIERLMRTTTKDPLKKNNSVDQGIEYSDYYSEDDVLQDIAANKIPIRVAVDQRNPNDRFTRQTVNSTSFYTDNQIDSNLRPYYQDYDAPSKDFIYNDNFYNYPTGEHSSGSGFDRNSRLLGTADELTFPDDRREHFYMPHPYPVVAEDASEQPNNAEVRQFVNTNQLNYANRYENQVEHLNPKESVEPETANVNFPQNGNVNAEVPEFSNKFSVSKMQNFSNDRLGGGTNLQRLVNYDQSITNSPLAGNTRFSSSKEDIEARPRSNFDDLGDQSSLENNNLPSVNLPNAMDQPLGKILESLGINVNTDTSNSVPFASRENAIERTNNRHYFPSDSLDRPVQHMLSPSYLKQETRNENTNLGEGYSRRQLTDNGIPNDNLAPFNEQEKMKSHNVNISIAMHDTKQVASELLDTIMEELEELKLDRAKNNKKEGLPCRLSGSWSTTQAGMKLDMKVVNHTIIATVSEPPSPRFHESLLNGTWNVTGHAPFKRGSPFTLIATDNHTTSIAVFVGACRVCQGIDTIAGVWSVARPPKDCRDFQVATSVFNDIFRKTRWSSLKEKEHSNGTETTTPKIDKKRS